MSKYEFGLCLRIDIEDVYELKQKESISKTFRHVSTLKFQNVK